MPLYFCLFGSFVDAQFLFTTSMFVGVGMKLVGLKRYKGKVSSVLSLPFNGCDSNGSTVK